MIIDGIGEEADGGVVLTEDQEAVATEVAGQFTDALESPMATAVDGLEVAGMSRYDAVHTVSVLLLTQAITNLRSAGVSAFRIRTYVDLSVSSTDQEILRCEAESTQDILPRDSECADVDEVGAPSV